MYPRGEVETAFLAVNNGHITFAALVKVFNPRVVRQYLVDAVVFASEPAVPYDGWDGWEFPYDVEFYLKFLAEFKKIYTIEEYPELYI